jgi:hypothetical protein
MRSPRVPHIDEGWSFTTRGDIVVVGTNPEMADVDNPRGYRYGVRWHVVASNEHGDTKELAVVSSTVNADTQAVAEALATRLGARLLNLGKLPVGFTYWTDGRPVYGSDAYVEYGQADDLALERREADDERMGL